MVMEETVVFCRARQFHEQEENSASLASTLTGAVGWVN